MESLDDLEAREFLSKYEDIEECESMIGKFFDVYPGLADYFETVKQFARDNGYVRDCFGRIRWVEGVNSPHKHIREAVEREACNAVIQGGTAGAIKHAMIDTMRVVKDFRNQGYICNPMIQIHDALLFEVQKKIASTFAIVLKSTMEACIELNIPVTASVEIGKNWGDLVKDRSEWNLILEGEGEDE